MSAPPEPGAPTANRLDHVRRPWLPACLAAHGLTVSTVTELSYLVVEEMVEDVTSVTVSAWPEADGRGRLRFPQSGTTEVAIPTADLYDQLYRGWLRRRPRIGDVFAGRVDQDALAKAGERVWREPLARLLKGDVYDLTAEARKVARLAFYAVRTDILEEDEAKTNDLEIKAVRDDSPAKSRRLEQGGEERAR